jgi:hypothetical protein
VEMSEITLEQIDVIRERTGVNYTKANEALKTNQCNIVDAIVYLQEEKKFAVNDMFTTKQKILGSMFGTLILEGLGTILLKRLLKKL